MGRQHDEDKVEQKKSEIRMNRWYNRLLNRHQDDPVSSGETTLAGSLSYLLYNYSCTNVHVHVLAALFLALICACNEYALEYWYHTRCTRTSSVV